MVALRVAGAALALLAAPGSLALAAASPAASPAPSPAPSHGTARPLHRPTRLHRAAQRHKTVVTFAWGGGLADQMPSVAMFAKYRMHATYFVPSGLVCLLAQKPCSRRGMPGYVAVFPSVSGAAFSLWCQARTLLH